MRATRLSPFAFRTRRSISGARWWRSAITSTVTPSACSPQPIGPTSRWWSGFIAFPKCVMCRAPAASAASSVDASASVWPRETTNPRFTNSFTTAMPPGISGASVVIPRPGAPEIPGGIAVVKEFVKRGFVVSLGHTEADASTLDAALAAGARHMTHFGNAMKPLHHRDVGPIGWGLQADGVTVDVIADLHHLAPEMLRLVLKAKGESRVALISDAMPAASLADGGYAVWGETLTVKDGAARNAAGALAGSTALLDDCVTRLASIGVPADSARSMAADVPRRILDAE